MNQKKLTQQFPSANKSRPQVCAVMGPLGAGKDTLAQYLVKAYQAASVEIGEYARFLADAAVRHTLDLRYDVSKKNLSDFETGYIIHRLLTDIVDSEYEEARNVVITGIRTPAEAAFLKFQFGADLLLVYVHVSDPKLRYERIQRRNFATDPDDFQGIKEQDERLALDNALAVTAKMADIFLNNEGSLEQFYRQIDLQIGRYLQRETV